MANLIPKSLSEALSDFVDVAEECFERPSLDAARRACKTSRTAFSAYLYECYANPDSTRVNETAALREGLDRSSRGAELARDSSALSEQDSALLVHYLDNIEFRLELVDVIRTEGLQAAENLMEKKKEELLSVQGSPAFS